MLAFVFWTLGTGTVQVLLLESWVLVFVLEPWAQNFILQPFLLVFVLVLKRWVDLLVIEPRELVFVLELWVLIFEGLFEAWVLLLVTRVLVVRWDYFWTKKYKQSLCSIVDCLPATWCCPVGTGWSSPTQHSLLISASLNVCSPRNVVVDTWGFDQRSPISTRSSYFNHLNNDDK